MSREHEYYRRTDVPTAVYFPALSSPPSWFRGDWWEWCAEYARLNARTGSEQSLMRSDLVERFMAAYRDQRWKMASC